MFLCGPSNDDLQEQFYQTIYQLTIRDFTTGLWNQRYIAELLRARTTSNPVASVAVLLVEPNAADGARAAHDVLANTVAVLSAHLPSDWYAGRIADFELAVIAPNATVEDSEPRLTAWLLDTADAARTRLGVVDAAGAPLPQLLSAARARARLLAV